MRVFRPWLAGCAVSRLGRRREEQSLHRPFAVVCALIVLATVGCSDDPMASDEYQTLEAEYAALAGEMDGIDQMRQQLFYERNDLEESNAGLKQELEAMMVEGDAIAAVEPSEACTDKLARCEEMLFPPDEGEEWPPSSPALWFPPTPWYVTESATIEVMVFAPESSEVLIAGLDVEPGGRWVGDNAVFIHDVPLAEGRNPIEIIADGEPLIATIERDSSLIRRFGRVLDSRAEWSESRTDHFLGIDYGDMDFEPEYGQGDFEAGDVIVEFVQLTPTSVAVVTSPYSSKIILTGEDDIWEYFSYEVSHFDPWSVLLDGDTLIQIEGPIQLGD